jgi:DNA-binding transcriptional MerR regulator/effector-binding domain-containing protein
MFTVGEFSRLAQVSKRLLRFYDEIGLLTPIQIDPSTGYRYYHAEQMTDLNRILALKDLGLSLDQIRGLIVGQVSSAEMQGMLLLKKTEIEQHLLNEMARIRKIESRLQAIRSAETNAPLNVVLKRITAQPVLSVRTMAETFSVALDIFSHIRAALPDVAVNGALFCMCHSETMVDEDMDLEIGCLTEASNKTIVPLRGGLHLRPRTLPPVETMATTVVKGALETIHSGYREIGVWTAANGYRLAGIPRELTLQSPRKADGSDLITEIQFPVETL